MKFFSSLLLLLVAASPASARVWVYNAMTIQADDNALKKKIKSGKVCFSVDSLDDLTKNFPGEKWHTTTNNRLIGRVDKKALHTFSIFVNRQECQASARLAAVGQ